MGDLLGDEEAGHHDVLLSLVAALRATVLASPAATTRRSR